MRRAEKNYLFFLQKQYMFVYRAVMEMAQFGDTEIEASKLKSTWLTFVSDDAGSKKLEDEFTRLASIVDDRKALSVGEFCDFPEWWKSENNIPAKIKPNIVFVCPIKVAYLPLLNDLATKSELYIYSRTLFNYFRLFNS